MKFSPCNFGLTLISVLLNAHVSEERDLPSAGLLEEMPNGCSNMEFCHIKHANYPQKQIDELLTKKYSVTLASSHEKPTTISSTVEESQADCEKIITYGLIYEIIDKNDNVRVVVQSPKLFKQPLRIEQCAKPGRLLSEGGTYNFLSAELEMNEIFCVEKRIDYDFLVLTRDGEGVEFSRSKNGIPIYCLCRINQD